MKYPASLLLACFLGAGLFPSQQAAAQTGTVTGVVQDDVSGLILPGAELQIEGTDRQGVSARTGRYLITGVPAGSQTLVVRYMGYAEVRQSVQVTAGATVTLSIRMTPQAIALEGITATGQRDGQARALQQQRMATNLTNIVAADQIGRFPDANIGDALKRIPGINVMVDQGEARFGMIRGTEPRLNSVTLNGERIPSAESGVREVQLDLIPADMVQAVEVNKAVTPDMEADAIGGSVNVVTRQAAPDRRISATLGSGYNMLAEQPMGLGSAVFADRIAADRLGIVLSASWFNHYLGSDNIEAEWEEGTGGRPFVGEMDIRRYDIQRTRRSFSSAFDYDLSPSSSLTFRAMYNHRDDWENRYRLRYRLGEPNSQGIVERADIRRQTKGGGNDSRNKNTRLEDQRVLSLNLGGNHLFGGRIEADWSGSYAKASEDRPDERYVEWHARRLPMVADISNPRKPQFTPVNASDVTPDRFGFRRTEIENRYTEEEDITGRLDFIVPLTTSGLTNQVKFGTRLRWKEKFRDNNFFRGIPLDGSLENMGATPTRDYSKSNYLAGNYSSGLYTTEEFLGSLNFNDSNRFRLQDRPDEYAAGNFTASENVYAGYGMWERELSSGLRLIAGVRVEHTAIDYLGNELNEDTDDVRPTSGSDSYTNVLPGLHLRYESGAGTVLRFAWTNTIARPNYQDLVPFRIVSFEDMELDMGNPDLDATTSMNFDISAERYYPGIGILSGGLFYKDINSFIFTFTERNTIDPLTGQEFTRIRKPLNGSNADLFGSEFAYQRQLDFLPGVWSGLGLYLNYTYIWSRVNGLNVEGRDAEDLPLPGTAPHIANASLSYDMGRLSLRGSFNYAHDFIDPGEIGDSAFYDRYYDTQTHVDVNGTITVTPQVRVFFEANNLTNQALRYYQGIQSRMMQEEFYNRRFTLGMKYDL